MEALLVDDVEPCKGGSTQAHHLPSVSPSSTLDLILPPTLTPAPPRRSEASGSQHSLWILEGGSAVSSAGASDLWEEGECFIAHLGQECDWGEPVASPQLMKLPEGLAPVVEVAAGNLHTLLLSASGRVWSCGGGWEGPLGHGDAASLSVPRAVHGLADLRIDHIAAGGAHSLAVSSSGELWSWGWGRHGQCGHGDTQSVYHPRRVEGVGAIVQVLAQGPPHPAHAPTCSP